MPCVVIHAVIVAEDVQVDPVRRGRCGWRGDATTADTVPIAPCGAVKRSVPHGPVAAD